jgi:serine protease Do
VHLKVNRSGETHDVAVTLGEMPSGKSAHNTPAAAESSPMHGVQVDELTADVREQLRLKPDVNGVVITDVPDGSPAADAGLQRGDVIEEINRRKVNSISDYRRIVSELGKNAFVLLVNRGGNTRFVVVQPE